MLQQLQGCRPKLMLPAHSPTVCPIDHPRVICPTVSAHTRCDMAKLTVPQCILVLLVSLQYPLDSHTA